MSNHNEAFGWPGIPPRWTSSSKQGVGTAYSTSSRVWFTISHGVLNEIYFPTIDRPQTRDMEFLLTDGESLFVEEKRDLLTSVEMLEQDSLGYRVTSRDPDGRYRLVKEIISDPHQPCVLVHTTLEGEEALLQRLKIYVLLAPHLDVSGAGNSAQRLRVSGDNLLVAWRNGMALAMGADAGFSRTSCGYVGFSDGWQDLHDNFRLDWQFDSAEDGNVAVVGELNLRDRREFTVGIGFGRGQHAAITVLKQSLALPFPGQRERFIEQWHRASLHLRQIDGASGDHSRLYRISRSLLLAHEDKTFAGAIIASASIPWGEAKGDEDLGGYHLVWTRDMVNSASALLACGDSITPLRALVYLACSQRADGAFPQNFWIDGTPYWKAIQLDEVAFPILLAWRLWKQDGLRDFDPYPMVKAAAGFLADQSPVTQQERWEEASGYSPSTLAATIAALICAADFAAARGEPAAAAFLQDYADFLESHLERWTVTTQGALAPGISRHYIRIHPAGILDPTPSEDPNAGTIVIANRPPGLPFRFPAKDVVDAGFLELVRYGIRNPGDTVIEDSLRVVDELLRVETLYGPVWRRYNHDGYGPHSDGSPYGGWGRGGAWPLLTGERAHYELAAGRDVHDYVRAIERFASAGGMLPEQVWDLPDLPSAHMRLGRPNGSAMPLMWAHAEYIKLLRSVADQQVFDVIPIVADRYLKRRGRTDLEIWKAFRQISEVAEGDTLRIQAAEPFLLHWSSDGWATSNNLNSSDTSLGIHFVDLPTSQRRYKALQFTFYWKERDRWEGRDYLVRVNSQAASAAHR
jgi:glucoamylase